MLANNDSTRASEMLDQNTALHEDSSTDNGKDDIVTIAHPAIRANFSLLAAEDGQAAPPTSTADMIDRIFEKNGDWSCEIMSELYGKMKGEVKKKGKMMLFAGVGLIANGAENFGPEKVHKMFEALPNILLWYEGAVEGSEVVTELTEEQPNEEKYKSWYGGLAEDVKSAAGMTTVLCIAGCIVTGPVICAAATTHYVFISLSALGFVAGAADLLDSGVETIEFMHEMIKRCPAEGKESYPLGFGAMGE